LDKNSIIAGDEIIFLSVDNFSGEIEYFDNSILMIFRINEEFEVIDSWIRKDVHFCDWNFENISVIRICSHHSIVGDILSEYSGLVIRFIVSG